MKKITHKYVPKELVDRPKKGFGVPIEKILSDSMPSLLEYYFSTDFIINQGIFNENEINLSRAKHEINTSSVIKSTAPLL